jgi:hypothetical protein
MSHWVWVAAACLLCADAGFLAARLIRSTSVQARIARYHLSRNRASPQIEQRLRIIEGPPVPADAPAVTPRQRERIPRRRESADTANPRRRPARRRPARPAATLIPTVPRPEDPQVALWASQIEAGRRKMTQATDGCRVTWDRSCRHGHPSWVVHLGYLAPPKPSSYQAVADSTPR